MSPVANLLPPHADHPSRTDRTLDVLVALSSAAFVHISNHRMAQRDATLVEAVRIANAHLDSLFKP